MAGTLDFILGSGILNPAWPDWTVANRATSNVGVGDFAYGTMTSLAGSGSVSTAGIGSQTSISAGCRANNTSMSVVNTWVPLCNVTSSGYLTVAMQRKNTQYENGESFYIRVTIDGVQHQFNGFGMFGFGALISANNNFTYLKSREYIIPTTDEHRADARSLITLGGIRFNTSLLVEMRATINITGHVDYFLDGEL